jgi:hypothetical protein
MMVAMTTWRRAPRRSILDLYLLCRLAQASRAIRCRRCRGDNLPMVQLFLEPHQLRRVNHEFVRYVRRNFPMRFYRREGKWPVCATAALLRMADTVDSIMALMGRRKLGNARALLRSLYEQVVVFSWVAVDPATRLERWEGASRKEQLKLHNEVLRYGETILTPKEAEEFAAAPGVPSTATMAHELDEYWPGRVSGLHEAGGLLSFHGLYQSVYRVGSRQTHGTLAALDPYVQGLPRRRQGATITVRESPEHNMLVYSLAAPLLGIALLVAARSFAWLDEPEIQRFINRATAEVARQRQARNKQRRT